MLKPPSDYQLAKVSLTSHPAKIDNLVFDTAVIFFVPKVANKGVYLTGLVCTIVQIIDRGEWGKEEVPFTVDASSFSNRKHREFDLTADAPYSLKIVPPPELRMGILEIYFDLTIHHNMAHLNNPSPSVDLSDVVEAIQNGAAAQVAATQTAESIGNKQAKRLEELTFSTKEWDRVPSNHIAVQPDNDRIGVSIFNSDNYAEIIVDLFLDINKKTGDVQNDAVIAPGGMYTLSQEEANLGVLLYNPEGLPSVKAHINLIYSTPAAQVAA